MPMREERSDKSSLGMEVKERRRVPDSTDARMNEVRKSAGTNAIKVEMVTEWMTSLACVRMKEGRVPGGWQYYCVVPIHEEKGEGVSIRTLEESACLVYLAKFWLSDDGENTRNGAMENGSRAMWVPECKKCFGSGARSEASKEKYCEKNRCVYMAIMNLEKECASVDRKAR